MNGRRRARALRALPPPQLALVAPTVLLLVALRVALDHRGPLATLRSLDRALPSPVPGRTPGPATARVVDTAATLVPGPCRCLPRSVAVWVLLRLRRCPADVRLGVARSGDGTVMAHAWVECDGMAVSDDGGAGHFGAFDGPLPLQAAGR